MSEAEKVTPQQDPREAVDTFDFDSVYANNTAFESSVWDLKIIFGQLEQHTAKARVDWHTAVTIPWLQAKILEYYLRVNITINEFNNGPVKIPARVLPPKPPPPSDDDDLKGKEAHDAILKIYAELFEQEG